MGLVRERNRASTTRDKPLLRESRHTFAHKAALSFILVLCALWVTVVGTQGEELTFTASVDRTRVGLDDSLTFTVSVSGKDMGGISEPQLPSLEQFEIVGTNSSSSSQFSIVNGKMTSSKTIDYIYSLRPLDVGKTTIGAATLKFKGKTYQTEPIDIQVVAGSVSGKNQKGPSPGMQEPQAPSVPEDLMGPDLFLRAEIDHKKVFQNQQVTVTYALYNRTSLANIQYGQQPTFTGFWTEEMYTADRLNFQQKVIGGKRYQVAVLKKLALFPTTSGDIEIEPMELICDLQVRSRDIFDFWGRTKRVRIASEPATIVVQPLPQIGKPPSFTGAVGQFSLKASVDQSQVKAGEPLKLTVEIRGQGNLKTLPPPGLPALDNFKSFEPEVQEDISPAGNKIGGAKTYQYVLIPKEQGQYRIESLQLPYFDPARKTYHIANTQPIAIEVLPGEKSEFPLVVGLGREEIKVVGQDIRYIKPSSVVLKNQGEDLFRNRFFWVLQIVPLMAVCFAMVARRRRDRISRDAGYARYRRAHRQARQGLGAAQKLMRPEVSAQFYGAVAKVLSDYLGDKLNLSACGITTPQLRDELEKHQVEEPLLQEVLDFAQTCDYSRFAPASSQLADMETILKHVRDLLARLEKSDL
jgi:hypothetical protein